MSIEGLMTLEVTIYRAETTTSRYGDTVIDWSYPGGVEDTLAWISQRSASENLDHRNAEISNWIGFFRSDVELTAHDRVVWNDLTFEVIGPPNPAYTPHGGLHHYEANLRVVEG